MVQNEFEIPNEFTTSSWFQIETGCGTAAIEQNMMQKWNLKGKADQLTCWLKKNLKGKHCTRLNLLVKQKKNKKNPKTQTNKQIKPNKYHSSIIFQNGQDGQNHDSC